MNMNLAAVQDSFALDTHVLFLSHTVDPETDDVPKLKAYAEKHRAIKINGTSSQERPMSSMT